MASFTANQARKAEEHIAEGEKCLKKWFGGSSKHEDAAESFKNAGNSYKVARMWQEASDAYNRAASSFEMAKDSHDACICHLESAKCIKNVSPSDAITAYEKVINYYVDKGSLNMAAKQSKEMGEIFEADHNYEDALMAYQQAADLHQHVDPPDFGRAAQVYEQLGRSCMEKKLLQANAKAYWLQAGLCLLALEDTVAAHEKLRTFQDVDYGFEDSRECKFLEKLITAVEGFDAEGFAQTCFEWDSISKLDAWKTSVLLRIKKSIEGGVGGDGDADVDLT